MQQGKQAGQGLVRVSGPGGGPAAEQLPLQGQRGGRAAEAAGFAGGEPAGGVGQDKLAGPGPAEELPHGG